MYEVGRQSANTHHEIGKQLANTLHDLTEEKLALLYDPGACRQTKKQKLCTQMGDLIHQLQISDTTNDNLAEQIKSLANENDHLKEKLVFLQHLMAGNTKSGISIHQFSLKETDDPGKYRYALTLTQGGERPSDFKGKLRFQVKLLQNDRRKTIPLVSKDSNQAFPINFKFLHRLEESFKVPPDAIVESLQVQVYENHDNKVVLTQTAQPMP
ncbi:hypothetical protein C8R34_11321 [Nitrosomonas sp. Nm84]|nr:hypothetical protein C8R34_11321 [Nitrosomonas sp. Nm84]